MTLGRDHLVPASRCLNCGHALDAATGVGDEAPTPGALTVCLPCGHLMAFASDLTMRELTDEEVREVAGNPQLLAMQWLRGCATSGKHTAPPPAAARWLREQMATKQRKR